MRNRSEGCAKSRLEGMVANARLAKSPACERSRAKFHRQHHPLHWCQALQALQAASEAAQALSNAGWQPPAWNDLTEPVQRPPTNPRKDPIQAEGGNTGQQRPFMPATARNSVLPLQDCKCSSAGMHSRKLWGFQWCAEILECGPSCVPHGFCPPVRVDNSWAVMSYAVRTPSGVTTA